MSSFTRPAATAAHFRGVRQSVRTYAAGTFFLSLLGLALLAMLLPPVTKVGAQAGGDEGLTDPPPLIISEFRLRGAAGANDEFVEIYNNSNDDVTVATIDLSAGYAVVASDGVTRCVIPEGMVIPARAATSSASTRSATRSPRTPRATARPPRATPPTRPTSTTTPA